MKKQLHLKTLIFSILLSLFFQFSFGQFPSCQPNPCLNGGRCNLAPITNDITCDCTEYWFGGTCQVSSNPILVAPNAPVVYKNDVNVPLDDAIQATGFSGGTYGLPGSGPSDMTITFTITGGTLTLGSTGVTFGGNGNGSSNFTATGQAETVTFQDGALNIALNDATFTPTTNLFGTNAASITFSATYGPNSSNSPATVTFDILDSTLSIDNLNFERNIKVYPIPANQYINIANNSVDIITKIEIIDMLGNIVSTNNFSVFNSNLKIDVSVFNTGIYFIKISKQDYTVNRKIILN